MRENGAWEKQNEQRRDQNWQNRTLETRTKCPEQNDSTTEAERNLAEQNTPDELSAAGGQQSAIVSHMLASANRAPSQRIKPRVERV